MFSNIFFNKIFYQKIFKFRFKFYIKNLRLILKFTLKKFRATNYRILETILNKLSFILIEILFFVFSGFAFTVNTMANPDSLINSATQLQIVKENSFLLETGKTIDFFYLERSNFYSPIKLISFNTSSFLLETGLPSNFYDLSLYHSSQKKLSLLLNGIVLNEPLTNLFDLRDFRFDEVDSIVILSPLRAFLFSRNNDESGIYLIEKNRFSIKPFSRIKYMEAPYDNLFFDGIFNVSFSRNFNFDFGITKHNALGRFKNSEKDLWAGKLKFVYIFNEKLNFDLTYRYSKSLVRFNEGININNPNLLPNETITDILYDNQRAIVINDDAYHKWTFNIVNLNGNLELEEYTSKFNLYFNQSLREFRDNEHKQDSLKILQNHWSKIWGINLRQQFPLGFNQFEFNFNFEKIIIESPFYFSKVNENRSSISALYKLTLLKSLVPSFYIKANKLPNQPVLYSFGSDVQFRFTKLISMFIGYSQFKNLYSYDELYFNNFDLTGSYSNASIFWSKLILNHKIFNISIEGFLKTISNPSKQNNFYSSENSTIIRDYFPEKLKTYGTNLLLKFHVWKITSNINFTYSDQLNTFQQNQYHKIDQPRFLTRTEIFYRGNFFKESLDLLLGIRLVGFSSFSGKSFSPEKLIFVDTRAYGDSIINFSSVKIPANFTLDIFASGRVQDAANVYLSLENIFNRKFYLMPYYPVNDIQFRFGISWEFWD